MNDEPSCDLDRGIALSRCRRSAADQWPQFRGLQAGVAADDHPARHLGNRQHRVEDSDSRSGLELAVVWDDHIFLTAAIGRHRSLRPGSTTTRADTDRPPSTGAADAT